jgi:hypothetical protein
MMPLTPSSTSNHMMSTFVHSHLLSSFLHSSVIDTDRVLLLVHSFSYERPLAFNIMPARMRLHLRRLRDYFTSVSILSLYPTHMCVCLLSCPSYMCVNVGRVNQYEKKKLRRKKSFARPLLLRLLVRSRHWATDALCLCVCVSVVVAIEDRKTLDEVKKRKERNRDRHTKQGYRRCPPSCTCI